jgi:hypothetical protein
VLEAAEKAIKDEAGSIQHLSTVASKFPYYRFAAIYSLDIEF